MGDGSRCRALNACLSLSRRWWTFHGEQPGKTAWGLGPFLPPPPPSQPHSAPQVFLPWTLHSARCMLACSVP